MDGDDVGAGLGEGLEIRIAGRDHQMGVEDLFGRAAYGLHDRRPERNVGHEVAVHDVDMDPVGASRVNGAHFVAQFSEVGRKY